MPQASVTGTTHARYAKIKVPDIDHSGLDQAGPYQTGIAENQIRRDLFGTRVALKYLP